MSTPQMLVDLETDRSAFLQHTAAAVAYEIGSQLYDLQDVLDRHGWSMDDFTRYASNPAFRQMVQEAKADWAKADAKTRISTKSRVAAEEGLLPIYQMVTDKSVPPVVRLDAYKTLAKMGKVDGGERGGESSGSGPKFVVQMNFGGPTPPMTVEGKPLPATEE